MGTGRQKVYVPNIETSDGLVTDNKTYIHVLLYPASISIFHCSPLRKDKMIIAEKTVHLKNIFLCAFSCEAMWCEKVD